MNRKSCSGRWRVDTGLFAALGGVIGVVVVNFVRLAQSITWEQSDTNRTLIQIAAWGGLACLYQAGMKWYWQRKLVRLTKDLGNPVTCERALGALVKMGAEAVPVIAACLQAPAFQMTASTGKVSWDIDIARRLAVEALGRIKDKSALPVLLEVIEGDDICLRAKAAAALGELGDTSAANALIPLLGETARVRDEREDKAEESFGLAIWRSLDGVNDETVHTVAAGNLDRLGCGYIAQVFRQALDGQEVAADAIREEHRDAFVDALVRTMDAPLVAQALQAIHAIGRMRAVEAIPALRARVKLFSDSGAEVKAACRQVLELLESLTSLPRSADDEDLTTTMLPRTAQKEMPSADTLPRQMETGRN